MIVIALNFDKIYARVIQVADVKPKVVINKGNDYAKIDTFTFVKQVEDYTPYQFSDLKNIFFSVLNQ